MSQNWNPLQDLMVLQDRMNRLFEDATQRRARNESDSRDEFERTDWSPSADIDESEANYVITIDLPGVDRAALEINLDDNRLVVKGMRSLKSSEQSLMERPRGRFLRAFSVPSGIDQSKIGADYKDGVLEITLPKRKEQKSKRVEIKVSG